ncbi:MAG: hypothetical protein KGR16_07830 [Verrucomicrobia bacterium]|nr:hypothetical protein [Verrucomicrobiota bacterium]MDE3048116.1 hypothetical protein [Verrucomicrobiota bacterium]
MKKLIVVFIALACAFAVSSCCDQSCCPGNMRACERDSAKTYPQTETPYRWDNTQERMQQPGQERQHRRW